MPLVILPCDARRGGGKKKKGCGENEFLPPPSADKDFLGCGRKTGNKNTKNNSMIVKPLAPPARARGFNLFTPFKWFTLQKSAIICIGRLTIKNKHLINMAIFKESKRSLRWFLIIVGLYGVYSAISGLRSFGELPPLLAIMFIISVIINLIVLYVGVRFYSLIQTSSNLLVKFFWFQVLLTVANAIYMYATHLVNAGIFIFYGIGVLITIVIINSIKRLAKENSGQTFNVPTPPVAQR